VNRPARIDVVALSKEIADRRWARISPLLKEAKAGNPCAKELLAREGRS